MHDAGVRDVANNALVLRRDDVARALSSCGDAWLLSRRSRIDVVVVDDADDSECDSLMSAVPSKWDEKREPRQARSRRLETLTAAHALH